jgi:hypothetical protein
MSLVYGSALMTIYLSKRAQDAQNVLKLKNTKIILRKKPINLNKNKKPDTPQSAGYVTVVETIRIMKTSINVRPLVAIISMDPIITLSSGCVLNAITRMKLMTGLKTKLQSARITNVEK